MGCDGRARDAVTTVSDSMRQIDLHFWRPTQRAVFLFGIACLLAVNAYSQGVRVAGGDAFTTLLGKLQSGDTSIDFKELRVSSLRSKAEAAGEADLASRQKTIAALKAGKHDELIAAGEQVLRTAYLDLETHLMVASGYRELGNQKKFEFHRDVYLGLLNSIMDGSDGKSAKTAFVVIAPLEEFAVMRALEIDRGDRSLRRTEGASSFDVIPGTDMKTKEPREVWFNVDLIVKAAK